MAPAGAQESPRAIIHVGPERTRGNTGGTRTVRVAGVSLTRPGARLCVGQNGNVRHLRDRQAHVSGIHYSVRRSPARIPHHSGPRKRWDYCGDWRRRNLYRFRRHSTARGRSRRSRGQRVLRSMLLLPPRFSLLLLRKDHRLREQSQRQASTAPLRWVVAVHLYHPGQLSGQSAGRSAFRGSRSDRDFRGFRGTRSRQTNVGVPERIFPLRRYGGRAGGWPAWHVLSDEGPDAWRRDDHRRGFIRLPPGVRQKARRRSNFKRRQNIQVRALADH